MSAALIEFVLYRVALGAQSLLDEGAFTSEQVAGALAQRRKELQSADPERMAAEVLRDLPASAFVRV